MPFISCSMLSHHSPSPQAPTDLVSSERICLFQKVMDTDTQNTWLWTVGIMLSSIYIITLVQVFSIVLLSRILHCRKAMGLNSVCTGVLSAYDILHSNGTLLFRCHLGPYEGEDQSQMQSMMTESRGHSGWFWRFRGIGTKEHKRPLKNENWDKMILLGNFQKECCPESILA